MKTKKLCLYAPKATLDVEVADNFLSRAVGLMGRKSLGKDNGMLFVFDRPGFHSLWMFNTSIPLEAICFSEEGIVVDIIQLKPYDLGTKCPKSKTKYILEVNQGFSKRRNIRIRKTGIENA